MKEELNLKEMGKNRWVIPEDGSEPYMIVQKKKYTRSEMIQRLQECGVRKTLAIETVDEGRYEEMLYEVYHYLVEDPIGEFEKACIAHYGEGGPWML
jgi:hypothetical protein